MAKKSFYVLFLLLFCITTILCTWEDGLCSLLYPLHPRNSKPSRGKENHKGKMYNVRVCLKQKYKVTKLTFFSWSTDTLQSQNFIFFKKSQNFRCQRSIRGKVESSRKSSMEKRKWQKFLWHYEIKFLDPSPAQTLSILLFTSAFEKSPFCLFITLKGRIILAISYFVFILIE